MSTDIKETDKVLNKMQMGKAWLKAAQLSSIIQRKAG